MADLRLSGKNIGVLKDFDMKLGKLTLLSGECGSGKTTLLKTLCYLTEAGTRLDESVFQTLLTYYMDLSSRVEERVRTSNLTDERKKEISEILWDEGIECYMDEFLEEGLVTEEEYKTHKDVITHNYYHYEDGDERFLSDLVADEIEDSIDFEFPYLAECGNDGEKVMRLEGFAMEKQDADVAEVVLDEDSCLKTADVPVAPECLYLSNVPLIDQSGLMDEEEEEFGYRTIEERGFWRIVEADVDEEDDGEEEDEEELEAEDDFQDKLETALERFLMDTVRGSFEYDEDDEAFTFYRESDGEGFELELMPSSYKAVADLALLIRRRAINDSTILVVDGLEQTMSPQWKTCLAEFLVGLSRLGNVRVVVSSMSSEFIEAITYFADEYLEEDQFRCYLTEFDEEWKSSVTEVTDDFEPLEEFLNGPVAEEDYEEDEEEEDPEEGEVDDYFDPSDEE